MSIAPRIKNLDAFLSHCQRHRFPARSAIICAGDKGDSLFYIMKGSVTVLIEDDEGKEMIVAYLNPGDFFGEMGLFKPEERRSAWVRAKTECHVAEIGYERFREIGERHPEILFELGS
ncbi:MAG: cyclic nucleotide-binding domain-containing protein, partial [Gammaproteobacteria bacterium]